MDAQKDNGRSTASQIITQFLGDHARPTKDDWKTLINQNPWFASDISDAALVNSKVVPLDESEAKSLPAETVSSEDISKALNLVHSIRGQTLTTVQAKVSGIKGPAIRALATESGLDSEVSFMNDILSGAVSAPKRVLKHLASKFDTSVLALVEVFQRAFEARVVPSFKAENGKPVVSAKQRPWAEAVNASSLSAEKKKAFLALDE